MNATKGNDQRPARGIKRPVDKLKVLALGGCAPVLRVVFWSFLAICLVLADGPVAASDFMVPVKSIAQITIDDDNRHLNYPVSVYFDPAEEEIYVINGGTNRVVIYGPDFFPRASIGNGRGIFTPRGVLAKSNGEVYICQVKSSINPSPRITILNGAFFLDREIFLDQIPEAVDFRPRGSVLNRDNIIYLAGDNERGVLVLDNEGTFLRRLQPQDQIILRGSEIAEKQADVDDKQAEQEQPFSVEVEEMVPAEDMYADIPEEFRPKSSEEKAAQYQEVTGPVKINHINIDSTGNLYLISPEVGKIYVYGPDESLRFSFGIKGGSPGQMSLPRALVVDEEHELIHVADYMRHTILTYDMTTGEYLFEFGGRGFNPGWFNFPNSIALNNYGQVIVADLFNRRVQVLEIGFEAVAYYRDKPSSESSPESSETLESIEQDKLETVLDEPPPNQEIIPESSIEQGEEIIQALVLSDQPLPDSSAALESAEQDKLETGQPDGLGLQEKETAPPRELPNSGIEEKKIVEEEINQAFAFPEQPEVTVELPDLDAVDAFVRSWAEAWEQKNVEAYVSHYSRNFSTPEG